MGVSDFYWMQQAHQLALQAQEKGEVPVGALVVDDRQRIIGIGSNQVLQMNDPTAHAELLALKEAAAFVKNHRINDATLYVTLEPCCMCAGAMLHARISRLVFATRDFKAGAAGSVYNLLKGYPLNHQIVIDEGIMQKECEQLLQEFFKVRR